MLTKIKFIYKFLFSRQISCIAGAVILFSIISFTTFNNSKHLPDDDAQNAGLFLPENFKAVVVADSLAGRARHLAVNSNGDIYVKLRYPDSLGGNVALRDTNHDGRADIIQTFDDYEDKGSYGTAMRIYNGYLYFSSELNVYRQKLTPGKLIPESEIELIVKDDDPRGQHEHDAKPITFDNDGHIYVPFGAPSNCCQEQNRVPGSPVYSIAPYSQTMVEYGSLMQISPLRRKKTGLSSQRGYEALLQ